MQKRGEGSGDCSGEVGTCRKGEAFSNEGIIDDGHKNRDRAKLRLLEAREQEQTGLQSRRNTGQTCRSADISCDVDSALRLHEGGQCQQGAVQGFGRESPDDSKAITGSFAREGSSGQDFGPDEASGEDYSCCKRKQSGWRDCAMQGRHL